MHLDTVKVYKQTKYTSNNAVVQYLNRVYLRNITGLVQEARPERLLDVGCGEGVVLRHLDQQLRGVTVIGLDVDGTNVFVRVGKDRHYRTGEVAAFAPVTARLHVFDKATGASLRRAG